MFKRRPEHPFLVSLLWNAGLFVALLMLGLLSMWVFSKIGW